MDTYDDMDMGGGDESYSGSSGSGGDNFFKKMLKNQRFLIFVALVILAIIGYFIVKKKFGSKDATTNKFIPLKGGEDNEDERDVENFIQHRQQQGGPPPQQQQQQQQYAPAQQQQQQQQYAPAPPQPAPPKVRESMDAESGTLDGGFQGFGDIRGNANNSFIKNLENKFANPGKRNIGS